MRATIDNDEIPGEDSDEKDNIMSTKKLFDLRFDGGAQESRVSENFCGLTRHQVEQGRDRPKRRQIQCYKESISKSTRTTK